MLCGQEENHDLLDNQIDGQDVMNKPHFDISNEYTDSGKIDLYTINCDLNTGDFDRYTVNTKFLLLTRIVLGF